MQIVEQSPTRLVIRQQRAGTALLMIVFTLLSLFSLLTLVIDGVPRLLSAMNVYQVLGWIIWLGLALGMVITGALLGASASRGVRCILDKRAETVTIEKTRWLRSRTTTHSIYGVARAEAERNEDVRVFGIFLVLRSGERLALATLPLYDEDAAQHIVRTIRQFLQSRLDSPSLRSGEGVGARRHSPTG